MQETEKDTGFFAGEGNGSVHRGNKGAFGHVWKEAIMMSEQIWHIRRARAEDASRIAEIWMRALRFYEKNGFAATGGRKEERGPGNIL